MYVGLYSYVCMYVCMYVCRHVCIYIVMYVCTCVCICVWIYVCIYVVMCIFMQLCNYICIYTSHPVRTTHQSSCISDGVSQHNNSVPSANICTSRILNRGGRGWASALLLVVNVSPATFQHPAPSPHLYPWPGTWSVEPHKFATNFNLCESIHMEISYHTACFNIFFVFPVSLPCLTERCDKLAVIPCGYIKAQTIYNFPVRWRNPRWIKLFPCTLLFFKFHLS